jgi:hypothetical protein
MLETFSQSSRNMREVRLKSVTMTNYYEEKVQLMRSVLKVAMALALTAAVAVIGLRPTPGAAQPAAPVLINGLTATLFASGNGSYSNPDSVEVDSYLGFIYVGYQNVTAKDGSDNKTSTIVEYTMDGKVRAMVAVSGHCDGLRLDPYTHLLWATSNEDGNPVLTVINPIGMSTTVYSFPPTPHGGGYDDLAFTGGMGFIAASNPNLNSSGANVFPALDQIQLVPPVNGVSLRPVVIGNDTALDTTTNSNVTLNEVDPDSLTVDPQGDVVLDNQAGAELVFVHNPGTPQQSLTRIPLGTQVDDTVWATSASGKLLVADATTNAIWSITGTFTPGTVYTEAPNDSGVASFLGTLDLSTGTITPVGIGFGKPTGLAFIPGP